MNLSDPSDPLLHWDIGTAYDLFISLRVLHRPEIFGLRPSWAAGVRSRLPVEARKTLEEADVVLHTPLNWINSLPSPKAGAGALWALGQIPAAQRLAVLDLEPQTDPQRAAALRSVAARGSWVQADLEILNAGYTREHKDPPRPKDGALILEAWSQAEAFSERYLQALQAYYQNFFAEEEARILPMLQSALAGAQEAAKTLPLQDLMDHLTQGVQLKELAEQEELIFVPSFWGSPLIFVAHPEPGRMLIAFGARPVEASLIPGETVPDLLLQALKALADPTRLRILHFLAQEPQAPSELARRLRLRPPTVIHHLSALRAAGLVQILIEKDGDRRYAARLEAIRGLGGMLDEFFSRHL